MNRHSVIVSETLRKLMTTLPGGLKMRQSFAFLLWADVVGENAAAASQPEAIRDGILIVRTKSSVWSHELSFMKAHLISELNKKLGEELIKDVRFKLKGADKKKKTEVVEEHPNRAAIMSVQLSPESTAALRRAEAASAGLPEEMRTRLSRLLEYQAHLRAWRLQHGWTECTQCGSAHNAGGKVCPTCRIVSYEG